MTTLTQQTRQLAVRLSAVADSIQVDYCPLCDLPILIVSYLTDTSRTVEFYIDGQSDCSHTYTADLSDRPLAQTREFKTALGIVLGGHLDTACKDNSAIHFRKHTEQSDALGW